MFASCNNTKFRNETNEFKKFLIYNCRTTISEKKAVYLLIPSCQCKNCVLLTGDNLKENFNENLYIVSSLDTSIFKNFTHKLYDENDKIMKLSFLHYANQIVIVENGYIQNIIRLTNFNIQMDSIQKTF